MARGLLGPFPTWESRLASSLFVHTLDDFRYVLISVAGLSNTVALFEIAAFPSVATPISTPKLFWIKFTLFIEGLLLSFVIGFDFAVLTKFFGIQPFIWSYILFLLSILSIQYLFTDKATRDHSLLLLLFGSIGILLGWSLLLAFAGDADKLILYLLNTRISTFILTVELRSFLEKRLDSYMHLLFFPCIYAFADYIHYKLSRDTSLIDILRLDIPLLVSGIVCLIGGWCMCHLHCSESYLFEAGSCAALLILANYFYVALTTKGSKESLQSVAVTMG